MCAGRGHRKLEVRSWGGSKTAPDNEARRVQKVDERRETDPESRRGVVYRTGRVRIGTVGVQDGSDAGGGAAQRSVALEQGGSRGHFLEHPTP